MTPLSAMIVFGPRAHDDGLPSRSDGDHAPHGRSCKFFLPCPYCRKQNHIANKFWKQFGKPPIAQAVVTLSPTRSKALLGTPTPHYYVTLTLAEYDAFCGFGSTDASSSASLASLPTASTSGTSAHLASSSPMWIIDSRASSHMTGTSLLLLSYHPIPSHPPVIIADG